MRYKVSFIRLNTMLAVILILILYYSIGGASFPDYANYVEIANGNVGEIKIFEWISAAWFKYANEISVSENFGVDSLALMVQLLYLIWAMSGSSVGSSVSRYWVTAINGPLLLTTTLRASVPYLCAYLLIENYKTKYLKSAALIALGISFHDSFLLIFTTYIASRIFGKYVTRRISIAIFVISLLILILGMAIGNPFLYMLGYVDLGLRNGYFLNSESASTLKIIYALMVGISVVPLFNLPESKKSERFFVLLSYQFSCIIFLFSSTVAIRLLIFVIGMSITLGLNEGVYPKFSKNKIAILVGWFVLGLMSWDLLRHG